MTTEDIRNLRHLGGLTIIGNGGCGKSHLLIQFLLWNYRVLGDSVIHFVTNTPHDSIIAHLKQKLSNRIKVYNSLEKLPELPEFARLNTFSMPDQPHFIGKPQYIIFDDIVASDKIDKFITHGSLINVECIFVNRNFHSLSTESKYNAKSCFLFKDMSSKDIAEFVFYRDSLCAEFIKSTVLDEAPKEKFEHPVWSDRLTNDEAEMFNTTCCKFQQEYRKQLGDSNPFNIVRLTY